MLTAQITEKKIFPKQKAKLLEKKELENGKYIVYLNRYSDISSVAAISNRTLTGFRHFHMNKALK